MPIPPRLPGSLAALTAAWRARATLVRVHDVAANRKSVEVTEAVLRARLTPRVSTEATC